MRRASQSVRRRSNAAALVAASFNQTAINLSYSDVISATPTTTTGSEKLANPTFDVDASSWTVNGAGSIARDTGTTHSGAGSLKVIQAGGLTDGAFAAPTGAASITAGNTYRLSVWVNAPLGGKLKLGTEFFTSGAVLIDLTQASFTGTGAWQQVTVDAIAPATSDNANLFVYSDGVAQSLTFYIDDASIKQVLTSNVSSQFTATRTGTSGTELLPNPFIDTAATGWVGNDATVSFDNTVFRSGGGSLKVIQAGTVTSSGAFCANTGAGTLLVGNTYRGYAWVNAPVGVSLRLGVEFRTAGSVFISATDTPFVGNGSWQPVTLDVVAPATSDNGHLYVYGNGALSTATFNIDDASLQSVAAAVPMTLTGGTVTNNLVNLVMGTSPNTNDLISLSYTAAATPIHDANGNNVANFSNLSISSSGFAPPPPPPPTGSPDIGIIANVAGYGPSRQALVLNFYGTSTKQKWIREDRNDYAISWAHSNGVKVVSIYWSGAKPAVALGGDVIELDNEPYWTKNLDVHAWAATVRDNAVSLKNDPTTSSKPILLPLLGFANTAALGAGFDGSGNYTSNGVTKPWVQWVNEGAPNIWGYVDGFAVHPYAPNTPPSFAVLDIVRGQLNAIPQAVGKLFWATEIGWATGGAPVDWKTTEANQSLWLKQFIDGWKARHDVGPMFVYQFVDLLTSDQTTSEDHYGLLYSDEVTQKPAYATVRSYL